MVTAHDCDSLGPGPGSCCGGLLLAINNNNNTLYWLLHDTSQHPGADRWSDDGLDRYQRPQLKMASILQVVLSKGITSLKVSVSDIPRFVY